MKNHHQLLIALVAGALLGTLAHSQETWTWVPALNQNLFEPLGQVFLRLIFMIVVPMVFSGLLLGVFQLGQHRDLGKVVSRTLLFTVITSAASVLIGISLVQLIRPGQYVQIPPEVLASQASSVAQIQSKAQAAKPALQALIEIIPKNPLESAVNAFNGEMLALMFFALIFGYALSRSSSSTQGAQGPLLPFFEQIYEASMKIVGYAMKLAPFAVFALVFQSSSKFGVDLLISLLFYVGVVVAALLLQQFVVYSVMLKSFAGRSPWAFFKECREVYVYAFATSSSNATLPESLKLAETRLRLPPSIARFVLTVGSTANQNGTALFEGVTVLFLAQVYGIDLSMGQQITVVLMSILAGIGTAGVPGGSLPLIMILLQQVGIPVEGMGLILGVDRFLDMCRTTVNVSGDLVIAAVVSHQTPEESPASNKGLS